jgi:chorismate dehydratase
VIRLGYVAYLNALPLVFGLDTDTRCSLSARPPAQLARDLVDGGCDVALVPIAALIGRPALGWIEGLCIGADGPVASVTLYVRSGRRARLRRIALDRHSRTSQLLVKIIVHELWGWERADIEYFEADPRAAIADESCDAVLAIGDLALRWGELAGFEASDLAAEWRELTGLPFVFALWVAPRELLEREPWIGDMLHGALAAGERGVHDIAEREAPRRGLEVELAKNYLQRRICYRMTPGHVEGMAAFLERAAPWNP